MALRNLRRQPVYTVINIAGLAIGLACFVLLVLFVEDERSYDRFHANADRIYRIVVDVEASQGVQHTAKSPPIWANALRTDFPEVASVVRFQTTRQGWMVRYKDRRFSEKTWTFADSTVFEVFDVPLVRGDPATALVAPYTVVLSQTMAARYFPGEEPLGKTLTLDNQYHFEVTGVMQDMPPNAHFHFDFLASYTSTKDPPYIYTLDLSRATFPVTYTYVLLHDRQAAAAFEAKLPALVATLTPSQPGRAMHAALQPLTDIHLHSRLQDEIEVNGDPATVYIFLAVAFFVLLIACINFMNLATARSARRAREVGMRKVVGAQRRQLMFQFLGEAVLMAVLALVMALALLWGTLPYFSALMGKTITMADVLAGPFGLGLLAVAVAAGLLAGSYPALYLSAFQPMMVLKGYARPGRTGQPLLRKGLIVFQFGISLILLSCTGIVYHQMQYVRAKKLGFDKEHVVVVQMTDPSPARRYRAYREAIRQHPHVLQVSASTGLPSGFIGKARINPVGALPEDNWQFQTFFSEFDFVETMGMELVAGRALSRDFPSDTLEAFILNETAARTLGWHDPREALGQALLFTGTTTPTYRVVGVVRDFHTQSVHEAIAPVVIAYSPMLLRQWFFVYVRIRPDDVPGTIAALQRHWERIIPDYMFDYSFLDQDFDRQYKSEDLLGRLLGYFTVLTIFIACLGFFGLASFTAEQRTKEIGVRKVLGASTPSIVLLLSKEFTGLVVVAFVLAVPVAYFAMDAWLHNFAYHIDMAWEVFLLAGLAAFMIAWLTVSYQSIKAALANPVRSLRYE